jgi:type 1 fimbria pilin
MRNFVCLAALAASAAVASPALAQAFPSDDAPATARGVVLQTHSLINQTNLDFGIVTTDSISAGTVVIAPDATGSRSTTGGVTALPSTKSSARFDGLAAPLETVVLTLTPPVGNVLQSAAGDQITVNSMSVDAAGLTRTASSTGTFTVYVGGDFGLTANQAAGVYSADFNLNAEYQ